MLPCQPSVQSRESSALPVNTTCLAFTVPPKNSTPSSRLLWTWMKSTSVPLPTPWKAMPFSWFSGSTLAPAYLTTT